MTQIPEDIVAQRWMQTVLAAYPGLSAAVGGRIYGASGAPQEAACPYIVRSLQSSLDVLVIGGERSLADMRYAVKVVGETADPEDLATIAGMIDSALNKQQGAVGSVGYVVSSTREQAISYPDTSVAGRFFYHLGGIYRLQTRAE